MSVEMEARSSAPEAALGLSSGDAPAVQRWMAARPRRMVIASDAAAVVLGFALASLVVPTGAGMATQRLLLTLLALVAFVAAIAQQDLYASRVIARAGEEARRLAISASAGTVAVAAAAYLGASGVDRSWLVLAGLLTSLGLTLERAGLRHLFAALRRAGHLVRPVVIVGANEEGRALRRVLQRDPALGYRVVAFVDDDDPEADGDIRSVLEVVRRTGANGVLVAVSAVDLLTTNRLARELTDAGIHVELSSTLHGIASRRLHVKPVGNMTMVHVQPVARDGWRPRAKRAFDIVMSASTLVVTSPLLLAAAIAVRLDSAGPILFRQERVGCDGLPFEVLKLRTMVVDAEQRLADIEHLNEADGPLFKLRSDPRVTRVGRWMRKASIDELPQLVNVLRGEMSMVGPRPALPREVAKWDEPLFARLRVQPGITGMWQVSGRSNAGFDQYQQLDLYYVDNWSLLTDVGVLLRTLPAVLRAKGAH